jgi:hypothetical protein
MSLNTLWEWGTSMDSSPEYCNATPNMIISIQCHNHKKIERYRRNLYRYQKLETMKASCQSEDWEKIAGDPIMMPLMYALL